MHVILFFFFFFFYQNNRSVYNCSRLTDRWVLPGIHPATSLLIFRLAARGKRQYSSETSGSTLSILFSVSGLDVCRIYL